MAVASGGEGFRTGVVRLAALALEEAARGALLFARGGLFARLAVPHALRQANVRLTGQLHFFENSFAALQIVEAIEHA